MSPPGIRPVENRTIHGMITSGGPGRAQRRPVIVGKGVAKPAWLATGPVPFLPQSPGCDRAPAGSPEALGYVTPVTRSLPVLTRAARPRGSVPFRAGGQRYSGRAMGLGRPGLTACSAAAGAGDPGAAPSGVPPWDRPARPRCPSDPATALAFPDHESGPHPTKPGEPRDDGQLPRNIQLDKTPLSPRPARAAPCPVQVKASISA